MLGIQMPRPSRATAHHLAENAPTAHALPPARAGSFFHPLRTLDGLSIHVVAARCGQDPAILVCTYARRTKKADVSAATIIGNLSERVLGSSQELGCKLGPR
jgi:hypothetical protein